ncbi:MAG: phosphatidate cytidylyltransferase [Neisseria sp.]|nr:phosphatidate cytidylyltransferase [Neisseria sp.]
MLKQRVLTTLILLPLMLAMLFFSSNAVWASFSGLIAMLTLWEYSRMCGMSEGERLPYLLSTAIFLMLASMGDWHLPALAWWAVLAFWLVLMPLWLWKKWVLKGGWQAYFTGWFVVLPFWFALIDLHPNAESALSLLSVMGLVWVADVFAYFFGKTFGKHKIAPQISPGKSWEGAIGGAFCVLIYMTIVRAAGWLSFDFSWFTTMLVALLLTVVSVCGDLLESWLKRAAGVKDSSSLLPGHGGVFDRVDSLIAVLSVYAAIQVLSN